jgi:subtilisin family serine protease/subtilisin-like proprotein convertase family protein
MKIKLLFLFLILIPISAFSVDHYYYENRKIDLDTRADKIAVVLNNEYSELTVRNKLRGFIGTGDEVKKVLSHVYLISFSEMKSAVEIQGFIENISSQKDIVKFATKVYYGSSKSVTQIPADVFIIKLRNPADKEVLDIMNIENNCSVIGKISDENGFLIRTNSGVAKNALELSEEYYASGIFEYAEPDFLYPEKCLLLSVPDDQYFNQQWALKNTGQSIETGSTFLFQGDAASVSGIPGSDMNVTEAWDYTTGSPSVRIGIIDSGIDSLHPDLQASGHLICGYDAFNNVNSSSVDYGNHGTSVAGIIGALSNNGIGISGIAPSSKLMSITIYDVNGVTSSSIIARAFDTARVRGIEVLCNGWGGNTPAGIITDAINNAAISGRGGLGSIILFGSGNDGRNPPVYPSYLPNVLSVGSSTPHDQKKSPGTGNQFYWGSNYGESISGDLDITAPTNCYTLTTGGGYDPNFSGTSASVPNAAGVAALVLSVNPALSKSQVFDNLSKGCDKIDNVEYSQNKSSGKWNLYYGYGRVNALNSVRLAAGTDVTPPTINHSEVRSHSSTYPTMIKAEITDQDGSSVPVTGINSPLLFYKVKKGASSWTAFDSVTSFSVSGNQFTFLIPSQGWETEVQYYIRARDNSGNETTFPKHAPNNFWLCYYSVGNIISETKKIPSFTGADFGATISPSVNFSSFKILHAKIRIYMRHTYLNDEIIQIFTPLTDANNNRKCLFSSNGNDMDNITGASVSDSATSLWLNNTPPYWNGHFKPEFTLNGLYGQNAGGNWRILHFDRGIGDYAFFDSVKITLCRSAGTASAAAKLDRAEDSLVYFENVSFPNTYERNFYLKNSGTANLSVSGYSFSGSFASMYSIINVPPANILPSDSGLFKVRLNTAVSGLMNASADSVQGAVLNILTNDPSKNTFRVSLQTNDSLNYGMKNLHLKLFVEGMLNPESGTTSKDTISVYLRKTVYPFTLIDSAVSIIDTLGAGDFNFAHSQNNVSYFIVLKHRSGLETWSAEGQTFISSLMNYDFTDNISKAYGDNLILKGSKYCIYSGDVNYDGYIDLTDQNLIFNASNNFKQGYSIEDINGDYVVDLTDIAPVYNNSINFIRAVSP